MVRTASTMPPLNSAAPDFALPDGSGTLFRLSDFEDAQGLLVAFWCNHCPFVKHLRGAFIQFARDYVERGIAIVAINSNDAATYPDDSPEAMVQESERWGFPFPYLVDETQDTARQYRAACTPDFFLFDQNRQLTYRGQFDTSRPTNDVPATGADLRAACDALLAGASPPTPQIPSLGCNIKWKLPKK